RRQRIDADRVLALQALVTLDAAIRLVFGLALFPHELHAADAAVARVDELEVIDEPVRPRHAVRRVRAGAIDEHGDEQLVGGEGRAAGERREDRDANEKAGPLHMRPPLNAEMARGAASPSRPSTTSPARAARRSGRR